MDAEFVMSAGIQTPVLVIGCAASTQPRSRLCSSCTFFFLRKPVPTVRWNREGVRMDPGWSSSSPVKKFIAGVWEGCEGGLPQKAPHVINHCSVVYLNIPRIIL